MLRRNGLVSFCKLLINPHYPGRSADKIRAGAAGLRLEDEFGNFFSYQLIFKKTQEQSGSGLKFNPTKVSASSSLIFPI